jgi:hypothetical protein
MKNCPQRCGTTLESVWIAGMSGVNCRRAQMKHSTEATATGVIGVAVGMASLFSESRVLPGMLISFFRE